MYKSAASQGDEKALNQLGMIYYRKGKQNEAIKWYKQAANLGNLNACNKLGNILQQSGHCKDALFWYRQAALGGDSYAQTMLGSIYLQGIGVEECDEDAAIMWYKLAAIQGHQGSQLILGFIYEKKRNIKESISWYQLAANQGSPEASYRIHLLNGGESSTGKELFHITRTSALREEVEYLRDEINNPLHWRD